MSAGRDASGRRAARKSKPAARRQGQTRTLLFIALCFAGSAATRMGDVGAAFAQNAAAVTGEMQTFEPTALPDSPPPSAAPAASPVEEPTGDLACACGGDEDPLSLLAAIRERDAALAAREAKLAEREGLLAMAEGRIKQELEKLEEAEARLAATLNEASGAAAKDVAHLVGVYQTMKPKDAAEVFGEMEPSFAAGFLARMNQDSAGAIIAAMEPNSAYAVTAIMAGRNVNAGRVEGLGP
jgi:flagellar motility protein MotE (MotC chaperone)